RHPPLVTSPAGDPLCGTRYRTLQPLGRGGMGEVVLAEHVGLGKRVVVKLLHEEFAKDQALVRRMQVEARSLAALASPHVVQVTGDADHVGLGSDFDGISETPAGLENAGKLPAVTDELVRRGYKENDIRKILGGNFLRVFGDVQRAAGT
ncbi:MAG: membrane dipeptidase, partial [Candidatus Aminicenantales bacterium]